MDLMVLGLGCMAFFLSRGPQRHHVNIWLPALGQGHDLGGHSSPSPACSLRGACFHSFFIGANCAISFSIASFSANSSFFRLSSLRIRSWSSNHFEECQTLCLI